jgi:subtilase family serine protease
VARHLQGQALPGKGRRTAIAVAALIPLTFSVLVAAGPAQAAPSARPLPGSKPTWASAAADRGATPGGKTMDVRVYLAGRDAAGLEAYARDVTDPHSAVYRHYLSAAQTEARFGASPAQLRAVTSWLASAGLTVTGTTPEYVAAHGTVSAASTAFGTSFHQYASGGSVLRAPSTDAKVPAAVAEAILGVGGLSETARAEKPASATDSTPPPYLGTLPCSAYQGEKVATNLPTAYGSNPAWAVCGYVPRQVRSAYGVAGSGLTGKGVTVAIVDAYGLPTMEQDADTYATLHGDKAFKPGQYREIVDPTKWTDLDACGGAAGWAGEEVLDVESVHGMAPDANILYVGGNSCYDTTGGGAAPNGGLLDSLALIVDQHLADMVSNSWGEIMHALNPDGSTSDIDPALIKLYEQVFKKGAVEGIGFYFSSGDCGAEDPTTGCGAGNGSARSQLEYPTSDPWVTSVGGTAIGIGQHDDYEFETGWHSSSTSLTADHTAWNDPPGAYLYGGGGGTSEDFSQPWYQSFTVPQSLSTHLLSGATTSPMRVGPDVAAYGDPSTGFLYGYTQPLPDGTTGYGEGSP